MSELFPIGTRVMAGMRVLPHRRDRGTIIGRDDWQVGKALGLVYLVEFDVAITKAPVVGRGFEGETARCWWCPMNSVEKISLLEQIAEAAL